MDSRHDLTGIELHGKVTARRDSSGIFETEARKLARGEGATVADEKLVSSPTLGGAVPACDR